MNWLERHWYRITPLHLLLWPLSLLFALLAGLRCALYRSGVLSSSRLPVPVIVIGNISVGGTGKTPVTLWLAQQLQSAGWHPAIISRGYNKSRSGQTPSTPRAVSPHDSADITGDEPLLMAQRRICPVWIGRDRAATAQALLQAHPECNVILSDDGLQHYRLQRDVEIAVVDGNRKFGNGLRLPAGPLREPVARLKQVDAIVVNGAAQISTAAATPVFAMHLEGNQFYNLLNPATTRAAGAFAGQRLHALAGIGHPQRFFAHLEQMGLSVEPHAFPDHHAYRPEDIRFDAADAILMTEKDAVKCAAFASANCWVLRVDARLAPAAAQLIMEKIKR